MLRVDRRGVRLERDQMRLEFLEVCLVTDRAELRIVELLELFHQFGMSRFETFLRRRELISG